MVKANAKLNEKVAKDPKIIGGLGVAFVGLLGENPWAVLAGLVSTFSGLNLDDNYSAALSLIDAGLGGALTLTMDLGDCDRRYGKK